MIWIAALFIFAYILYSFVTKGFFGSLNMNFVIFLFIGINCILFPQPRAWINAQTLPVFTFLSASVTNLFIPSQGGQFTVQGPLIVSAANQIGGSNLINCLNAFVLGDECINLLQPLYVIPALSVVGMKLKDIWGFMAFICMFWIIIVCLGLYFLPMII